MAFVAPRPMAKVGVRLALVQALAVVLAFALAGYIAQLSLQQISQRSIHDHVRGESASLDDEFIQKGAAHLPLTVAKRSRLWRGFEYRLVRPDGSVAGRLPPVSANAGWSEVDERSGGRLIRYRAYTHQMPDGAVLTVGQDLATEAGEARAITQTLMLCGLLGVVLCIALSYLFTRGAWRRVARLSATAHAVSDGRLDMRVGGRPGPPRDDVDELGQAFDSMLDRINLLIGQVRQVSTDIAHDLRTPLTRFRHKLERLRRQVGHDPVMLSAVTSLEADVSEILRTFDALLQLTEIEASDRRPGDQIFDLSEMVSRVVEAYRPDIEESGRALDYRPVPAAAVSGDPDLLAQGLANLLENTLRHTPVESRIAIEVLRTGAAVQLIVADDGPGIAVGEREQALKPFVRLDPSRRIRGSGLGLAIVSAIAGRHGAELALEDASPGLRVRLTLATAVEDTPAGLPASKQTEGAV